MKRQSVLFPQFFRSPSALLLFALCLAPAIPAQVTQADYDRAFSLRSRRADLVDRAEIKPHWLPDGHRFWYRVQMGAQTHEFVLVDADSGVRQPAFDHAKLAAALGKVNGGTMQPDHLPVSGLEFAGSNTLRFVAKGKSWRCNLEGYSLSADAERESVASAVRVLAAPRPSQRTGDETVLHFVNRTANDIKLYWMDPAGERQFYGVLAAGGERDQHTYSGHVWLVTTGAGQTVTVFEAGDTDGEAVVGGELQPTQRQDRNGRRDRHPDAESPDGHWRALIRDWNVFLHDNQNGGELALSTNGSAADSFSGEFFWSPDSQKLVVLQTLRGEERKVYLVESSPKDQLQPKLLSYDYNKPGDKIPIPRPRLFDVAAHRQIPVPEELFTNAWSIEEVRWWPDASRFTFLYNRRGHQALRIVAVDARSGAARTVVDEASRTFIDYSGKKFSHYLDATREIIWMSERDGWNHLYLYDAETGAVKNQITKGDWVVRGVDWVDATNRQIWFRAGGIRPGQDPYFIHFCRVNFDGTGLLVLTEGDGTHQADFAPDRKFFVDSWSRVDAPPVTELRRASDGKLMCELERAEIRRLVAAGWQRPERLAAKGRDGKTDIYGVIFRPTHFDPQKKYPVLENIYAGPQDSFAPTAFKPFYASQELADLGFIVVQVDGMGTSNRSKKFHDVCWKNLADAGFPDRILWIQAAAAQHREMDLSRVGIYGGSAGGQNALRGLLDHGDFYTVGVADCGCHDNRMDKIWWNEQWLGWPVDESYARSSNVTDAAKLQGKLLLLVGELDHNVDPASTLQVVNALEKADKDFEMLVITGSDHGAAESPYGRRRRAEFFVRNLVR